MKPVFRTTFALEPSQGQKATFMTKGIPMGYEMAEKRITDRQTNKQTDR